MNNLTKWRQQIDSLDEQILDLLGHRFLLVKKIGKYKQEKSLSTFDQKRWSKVLELNLAKAESLNLSPTFVKKVFNIIHKYSLSIQKEIKKL